MRHIIQYTISKDDDHYVAEGVHFPGVTQAKTLDELVENIKEITSLLLEGEDPSVFGLSAPSSVLLNLELPNIAHA